MPKYILYLLPVIILVLSCRPKAQPDPELVEIDPSFAKFYLKFHEDSLFQVEHIDFPLPGIPHLIDSLELAMTKSFFWEKEGWKMHRMMDEELFTRHLYSLTQGLIIEKIRDHQGFALERRFLKRGEEWYLIYYGGMN